jgi:hypothetical protein
MQSILANVPIGQRSDCANGSSRSSARPRRERAHRRVRPNDEASGVTVAGKDSIGAPENASPLFSQLSDVVFTNIVAHK